MHKWLWSIDFLPGERGNWLSVSWLLTSLEGRSQGQAGSRSPRAQPDFYLQVTFKELGRAKVGGTRSPGAEGRSDLRGEWALGVTQSASQMALMEESACHGRH